MWTQCESFGKLEVSNDNSEPDGNLDEKKLEFCAERSSVTLYKLKQKRNCTSLQLQGENKKVATKTDLSVNREQNVVQLLSSKYKSMPMGCTDITEHKGRNFSCRNVGSSLYLLEFSLIPSETFVAWKP